jgi:hypothetical protein
MTYVLPPIAMRAAYFAMAGLVFGFFAAIAGLFMAIPRLIGGGGQNFGEQAHRASQRHGGFYSKPEFKRERTLVLVGFGAFLICFSFIFFLMLAFGQPVVN